MALSDIVLVLMALLTLAILAAGLFRRVSIPYTVLLVVIGIGLSELSITIDTLEPLKAFRLNPELVFFIFLPALIFESGLSLNARQLIKDLALPVAFDDEHMNEFIDWNQNRIYKLERGEGECMA